MSFGDGDAQRHQERSGWQDRYQAFEECDSKKAKDARSGDSRNHSSKRVHSLTRSLPRGVKRLRWPNNDLGDVDLDELPHGVKHGAGNVCRLVWQPLCHIILGFQTTFINYENQKR